MNRILWCVALGLFVFQIHCPANPPVGAWDAKTSARGQAAFDFAPNNTFIGYGIALGSDGLFLVTGTWSAVGTELTGSFQQIQPLVPAVFNFTGKATATRLLLKVTGAGTRFRIRCTPTQGAPNLAGNWNVLTVAGTNVTSAISLTASNGFPRVFAISDAGLSGVLMANAKQQSIAFVEAGAFEATLRGKFDALAGTARLNGRDQDRKPIKWRLEAVP